MSIFWRSFLPLFRDDLCGPPSSGIFPYPLLGPCSFAIHAPPSSFSPELRIGVPAGSMPCSSTIDLKRGLSCSRGLMTILPGFALSFVEESCIFLRWAVFHPKNGSATVFLGLHAGPSVPRESHLTFFQLDFPFVFISLPPLLSPVGWSQGRKVDEGARVFLFWFRSSH